MTETYHIKKISENIAQVDIEALPSLYSPQSFAFFKDLEGLLQPSASQESTTLPLKLLVICQIHPLDDFQQDWLIHLKKHLYRQEVIRYFQQANAVLQKIKSSSTKVLYLSSSDCLGSFFELALACHMRIWFNKKPLIGFPEAEFGFFPGLNSLAMENKLIQEIKNHPQLPLIFKARDAFHSGLIHKAINFAEWHESLKDLLPSWLNSGYLNKIQTSVSSSNKSPRAYKYIKEKTLWRLNPDSDDELQHLKMKAHYFDIYLNHSSGKPKNHSLETFQQFSTELAAKQVFDQKFIRYLEVSALRNTELSHVTHEPILAMDVTHSTLPKGSLLRLIQSKKRLFLCCLEEDDLRKSLEVLYHRLSSIIKPEKLNSYWQNYVWWGNLGDDPLKCPRLSWMAEQELKLNYKDNIFHFIHIYRDINSYRPSIYEWCCQKDQLQYKDEVLSILACICKDVIITFPLGKNKRSISSIIRMAFLSDMITFCRQTHLSIEKVFTHLEKTGWVFASQSQQWEAFINYHGEEFIPATEAENTFFREFLPENPNFFSINRLFKELSRSASRGSGTINAMSVRIRSLIYAVLLIKKLAQLDTGLSLDQLDLLASRCLGVPLAEGTPLSFAHTINKARFKFYVERNWPHLLYLCQD